jgi:hypothetical protein
MSAFVFLATEANGAHLWLFAAIVVHSESVNGGCRDSVCDGAVMWFVVCSVVVTRNTVEICITLGRMTDSPFSPFSPVHPVPAK